MSVSIARIVFSHVVPNAFLFVGSLLRFSSTEDCLMNILTVPAGSSRADAELCPDIHITWVMEHQPEAGARTGGLPPNRCGLRGGLTIQSAVPIMGETSWFSCEMGCCSMGQVLPVFLVRF